MKKLLLSALMVATLAACQPGSGGCNMSGGSCCCKSMESSCCSKPKAGAMCKKDHDAAKHGHAH